MTTRRGVGAAAALVSLAMLAPAQARAEKPVRAAEFCVEVKRDDGTSFSCEIELRLRGPRALCLEDDGPHRFCGLYPVPVVEGT